MGNKAGKEACAGEEETSPGNIQDASRDVGANSPGGSRASVRSAAAAEPPTTTSLHVPSPHGVPGLKVYENVLTDAQHDKVFEWLLQTLEQGRNGNLTGNTYAPIPDKWKQRNQSREMLQFGVYTHSNRVETDVVVQPMPVVLLEVVESLRKHGVYAKDEDDSSITQPLASSTKHLPDSCTVNLYNPGQWIPPHIDNPQFERPIVTVSLRSTQVMTAGRGMRWPEGKDPSDVFAEGSDPAQRSGEEAIICLPKNSAVSLRGDAADVYEHAVPPVSDFRASLTFRKLGDVSDPSTVDRIKFAEERRSEYRATRAAANSTTVKTGFGRVGPFGAVGRVGPLPDGVAEMEKRQRDRQNAIADKLKTKYASELGDAAGMSKSRAKKEAKKALRAAAKLKKREEDLLDPTKTHTQIKSKKEKEKEKEIEKKLVLSADGVTQLERSTKVRSCPPCPPELLGVGGNAKGEDTSKQEKKPSLTRSLPSVEIENVQKVYDAVASQWHGTRYRAWSGVADFLERCVSMGALVADVGCGNGKNAPAVLAAAKKKGGGAEVVGCDFSIGLLEICALERDPPVEVFAADAAMLPLRSESFDAALNIAVLHHISSEDRRKALASETMRILKIGGTALFYAWALEQDTGGVSGHHFESQDVLVPFHKRAVKGKELKGKGGGLKGKGEKSEAQKSDSNDPNAAQVFQRYCHVYKEGELSALFDHCSDWVTVDRMYYDCGNWCAEVTRTG